MSAILSPDLKYRYLLGRQWNATTAPRLLPKVVLWVMLNPSTADAEQDDPTIRRCISFSQMWGFDALAVVNLYALRSTNPSALKRHPDPVGPENNKIIRSALERADMVLCAWGAPQMKYLERERRVLQMIREGGHAPRALGLTANGSPTHPLYIRADTQPITFAKGETR